MFYIRADANASVSSGHIMRCIAVAECLEQKGHKVTFLVADAGSEELLVNSRKEYRILNSAWNNLDLEVDAMRAILQENSKPVLLIDSYYVTRNYVEQLQPYAFIFYLGSKREYLGGISGLINYSCDIDYSFYAKYDPSVTRLLLGPQYAPLRREFSSIPEHFSKEGCRILLTTGNSDPGNYVPLILDAVLSLECSKDSVIDVIVGLFYSNVESLTTKYGDISNVVFHYNVANMSKLMKESDLAISANGTTVYELAASYVPVISFSLVEEQKKSARSMQKVGIVDYAGEIYTNADECVGKIKEKVLFYCLNPDARRELSRKANRIVDGNGCLRIAELLESPLIK